MTGILASLASSITGGLAGQVIDLAKAYFPPDMPPEKRAAFEAEARRVQAARERAAAALINEAQRDFDKRIADLEGTAKDLKGIPILGPVMIFLRGSQRICWGFGCIYLDYKVFGHTWELKDPQEWASFYLINFLVLGFLFGERAIANVAPAIKDIMTAKRG